MASRKDQLHSYQFMLQRSIAALVMRETDPAQSPLRRGVGAAFAGVMVAVIIAAAFGIYGLLTKSGNAKWQQKGAVVIESETGATFVYDGKLTPMLNYTSALLLSGHSPPSVFTVSRNSLKGVIRQTRRGIPGAPVSLPDKKAITGSTWSLCMLGGKSPQGDKPSQTTLLAGRSDRPGRALGEEALIVEDQTNPGDVFMLWHGFRHRLIWPSIVLGALYSDLSPRPLVGRAWIDGIPEGDPIEPVDYTGRGRPSATVKGMAIGDVLIVDKPAGKDYYIVRNDGIEYLTPLQYDMYEAEVRVSQTNVPPSSVKGIPLSRSQTVRSTVEAYDAPVKTPKVAASRIETAPICAEYRDRNPQPTILIDAQPISRELGSVTGAQTGVGAPLADRVVVPPVHGAVIRTIESNAYSIVTDTGVRYPVASVDLLPSLGYSASQAVQLPAALVSRLPTGPTLSETAAHAAN